MKKNLLFSGILGLVLVLVAGLILAGCGNHSDEFGAIELTNSSLMHTITKVSLENYSKNVIEFKANISPGKTETFPHIPADSYKIIATLNNGNGGPVDSITYYKLSANQTLIVSFEGTIITVKN